MNVSKLGRYSSQEVKYWLHRGTRGRLAPRKHYTIVYRTGVVRLAVSMPNSVPSSRAEKALSNIQLYTSPDGNAEERSAIVNLAKRALSPLNGRVSDVSFTQHRAAYPYFIVSGEKEVDKDLVFFDESTFTDSPLPVGTVRIEASAPAEIEGFFEYDNLRRLLMQMRLASPDPSRPLRIHHYTRNQHVWEPTQGTPFTENPFNDS